RTHRRVLLGDAVDGAVALGEKELALGRLVGFGQKAVVVAQAGQQLDALHEIDGAVELGLVAARGLAGLTREHGLDGTRAPRLLEVPEHAERDLVVTPRKLLDAVVSEAPARRGAPEALAGRRRRFDEAGREQRLEMAPN